MKKYVICAGITIIVLLSFGISVKSCQKWKTEAKRAKANFDIEISNEKDRLQTLSTSEFKRYFPAVADTLKSYGIKPKQVENVINIKYVFKDSLIPKVVLNYRDTLIKVFDTSFVLPFSNFEVESKCNTVKGYLLADTLVIESVAANDNLLISLYKERRKCLFGKRSLRCIAISECKGDTLTVLRNLKVGK